MEQLAQWEFGLAGLDAAADLRGELSDYAPGSLGLIPDGLRQSRPFRGLDILGNGGRKMVQIKDTYGSIDDDGLVQGKGSLFSTIADMLVMIGQGRPRIESTLIPAVVLSNVLKFLLKWNGSYTDPQSGPYAAGLPEPNKPEVGLIDGDLYGAPSLKGTFSIKDARYRKTTGGRSRASATSDVLSVTVGEHKSMFAVCDPIVTGQTHHIFFGTDDSLGGIGLHFRIARANPFTNDEYREEDVERDVNITGVSGASDELNGAVGTFSAGDIGKLVEPVSGLTFPTGTTVIEIISTSKIRISNPVVGANGTVTLVAYAGNRRRGVVLNWTPADLTEETAWILDFPPPTGSHAMQIENRMWVAAYADASARAAETASNPDSSASSTNPGTAWLPSLPNQFESYDPRNPLYMPEAIVDTLSDGMEGYKFAGGRNGIYAIMHLNVDRGVPATLTVLLRGEGIATPGNWCARERAIYLYTGKGQPVRIIEGGVVDKKFGAKIRHLMVDIEQEDMVVQGHPRGQGVMYAAGKKAWIWDEVTERWSTDVPLDDQYDGDIVSAVATQSRLIITKTDPSNNFAPTSGLTAYRFDEGPNPSTVIGVGHYEDTPAPQVAKLIQRLRAGFVSDKLEQHYIGVHVNTLPTHIEDGTMTTGSPYLESASSHFTSELVGSYVLVKKAGTAGGWLFGRIKAVVNVLGVMKLLIGTPVANLADSVDLPAESTVVGAYVLLALRIYPVMPLRKGTVEVDSQEIFLPGNRSYAVSIVLPTAGTKAQPLSSILDGELQLESWQMPSSTFG